MTKLKNTSFLKLYPYLIFISCLPCVASFSNVNSNKKSYRVTNRLEPIPTYQYGVSNMLEDSDDVFSKLKKLKEELKDKDEKIKNLKDEKATLKKDGYFHAHLKSFSIKCEYINTMKQEKILDNWIRSFSNESFCTFPYELKKIIYYDYLLGSVRPLYNFTITENLSSCLDPTLKGAEILKPYTVGSYLNQLIVFCKGHSLLFNPQSATYKTKYYDGYESRPRYLYTTVDNTSDFITIFIGSKIYLHYNNSYITKVRVNKSLFFVTVSRNGKYVLTSYRTKGMALVDSIENEEQRIKFPNEEPYSSEFFEGKSSFALDCSDHGMSQIAYDDRQRIVYFRGGVDMCTNRGNAQIWEMTLPLQHRGRAYNVQQLTNHSKRNYQAIKLTLDGKGLWTCYQENNTNYLQCIKTSDGLPISKGTRISEYLETERKEMYLSPKDDYLLLNSDKNSVLFDVKNQNNPVQKHVFDHPNQNNKDLPINAAFVQANNALFLLLGSILYKIIPNR